MPNWCKHELQNVAFWVQKQGVRFQHPLILLPIQLSAVLLILDIKEYKCSCIYRHKHINKNLLCTHFESSFPCFYKYSVTCSVKTLYFVVSGVYPDFSDTIKMVHLEILEAIKGVLWYKSHLLYHCVFFMCYVFSLYIGFYTFYTFCTA